MMMFLSNTLPSMFWVCGLRMHSCTSPLKLLKEMKGMKNILVPRASVLQQLRINGFLCHLFHRQQQARSAHNATEGVEEHPQETRKELRKGGPTFAERCKNLLAANWRAQLRTIKPKPSDKKPRKVDERIDGSLVNYIFSDGKVLVWLPEDSRHCANLLMDNRASLIVGHTDPGPLIKAMGTMKKAPPHAILLGSLNILEEKPDFGNGTVMKTVEELVKAAKPAIQGEVGSSNTISEASIHVLKKHCQALASMLNSKGEDAFYQLDARSCHFVDTMGQKHTVEGMDSCESISNPISLMLPCIVEEINQSETRRCGLVLFCAHYLHVKAQDALVFSTDKWGLDILAKVLVHSKESAEVAQTLQDKGHHKASEKSETLNFEWKEFRLDFQEEVKDFDKFFLILREMEKESMHALHKARAIQTKV